MTDDDKRELSKGYVNLKEHLEALWKEREKRLDDRFKANTKTLEATAEVLEHRLEILNNAHQHSLDDRMEFMRDGEFRNFKVELEKWQVVVNAAITTFNTRYESRITAATWTSVISLLVALLALLLRLLK
jgi:hypothetical protein